MGVVFFAQRVRKIRWGGFARSQELPRQGAPVAEWVAPGGQLVNENGRDEWWETCSPFAVGVGVIVFFFLPLAVHGRDDGGR